MKFFLPFFLLLPILAFPQSAKKYLRIGESQLDSAKFNEALLSFTKAIQLDSTFIDAYRERAKARQKLRDDKGAVTDLDIILKLKPDDISAHYFRGLERRNMKDYSGAIEDFTDLTKLQPLNSLNYANRASIKLRQGNYPAAIDDYSVAISANDDNKWSYYNDRGNSKLQLKDYTGAMDDFKESILIKPTFINYMSKGSLESYQQAYKAAIQDISEALTIYKQLRNTKSNVGLSLIYIKRAEAEMGAKMIETAQTDCDEALVLSPAFAPGYSCRGDLKHQSGDAVGACEDWTTAVKLGDTKAEENLKIYCK